MSRDPEPVYEPPSDLTPDGAPGRPVEGGQYAYIAESGHWMFGPADSVFGVAANKHFSVIVDGPYSSMARAEEALDRRFERFSARGLAHLDEQLRPSTQGLRGPHCGVVSWKRAVTFRDHTGVFGDQDGWQQIRLVYVDELP